MTKVLSIRQPWASVIVRGLKRFEIRTWQISYRGQLIIHASSATPTEAFAEDAFEEFPELDELMERVGISSLLGRVLFGWSSVGYEGDEPEEDGDEDLPDEKRLFTPSKELAAIIGERPLKRVDAVKKLWEYIQKHGLQDPVKKRTIHSEERLLKEMGKRKVDIFDMTSKLSKHLA